QGLSPRSLAELTSKLRRQAFAGASPHQLQGLLHLLVGNYVEKRGLFELYEDRLFQGIVEDSIACGVDEIGDDDRVTLGQAMGIPHSKKNTRQRKRCDAETHC